MHLIKFNKGEVLFGKTIKPAYFPIDNTEYFKSDKDIMEWLQAEVNIPDPQELRNFLGRMLFSNEDVFKKEVDSLRTFYKGEEDRQAEAAKQKEQEDYQNLQNTLLNTLNGFNEVVLDATDPQSDSLEIEDTDKQAMLQYLLEQDKDGQSQFDKDLSDPAALIEIAWLRTQGRNTISGLTQYWKKELADTRKELANVKKQLEKYQNKDNGTNVVVKPRAPKEKPKTVNELWDMYN
jgi:hypothetical protein